MTAARTLPSDGCGPQSFHSGLTLRPTSSPAGRDRPRVTFLVAPKRGAWPQARYGCLPLVEVMTWGVLPPGLGAPLDR